MSQTILVTDDEADIRDVLADILEDEGYTVLKAAHSEQAFTLMNKHKPDLIILDIWLENSDMDGMEILKAVKKTNSDYTNIPILMISGHGNIEMAVKAMKVGAYDFIEKPFKIDHILLTVERALESQTLRAENSELKTKINQAPDTYKSKSSLFQNLLKQIHEDKDSDARLFIQGDTGTGKTRLAHYIHRLSGRHSKPLNIYYGSEIKPDTVHKWFEDKSYQQCTILIKHVDCLSKETQETLLKVLSHHTTPNSPRLISTSFYKLESLSKAEDFSSALADRLAVITYSLPTLNDRHEDIPDLVQVFLEQINQVIPQKSPILSGDALHYLTTVNWVGNVAQLKSFIEFISYKTLSRNAEKPPLTKNDISQIFSGGVEETVKDNTNNDDDDAFNEQWFDLTLRDARDNFERTYLTHLIHRFGGNVSQMANHVDMERTALHRKLKAMDIRYESTLDAGLKSETDRLVRTA